MHINTIHGFEKKRNILLLKKRLHIELPSQFAVPFVPNIVPQYSKKLVLNDTKKSLKKGAIFDLNKISNCKINWMILKHSFTPRLHFHFLDHCGENSSFIHTSQFFLGKFIPAIFPSNPNCANLEANFPDVSSQNGRIERLLPTLGLICH